MILYILYKNHILELAKGKLSYEEVYELLTSLPIKNILHNNRRYFTQYLFSFIETEKSSPKGLEELDQISSNGELIKTMNFSDSLISAMNIILESNQSFDDGDSQCLQEIINVLWTL